MSISTWNGTVMVSTEKTTQNTIMFFVNIFLLDLFMHVSFLVDAVLLFA